MPLDPSHYRGHMTLPTTFYEKFTVLTVQIIDNFRYLSLYASGCNNGVNTEVMRPLLPPTNKACEGYVFTHVCLSMGEGEYLGRYPADQVHTPWDQVHPPPLGRYIHPDQVHLPGRYTPSPQAGTPPWTRCTPMDQVPPRTKYPPGSSACWKIWATSGWYTSY